MPDIVCDTSEESFESEEFKLQFLSRSDYSRAPTGPFKEEPIEDICRPYLRCRDVKKKRKTILVWKYNNIVWTMV
jgi:hypothetical protein